MPNPIPWIVVFGILAVCGFLTLLGIARSEERWINRHRQDGEEKK